MHRLEKYVHPGRLLILSLFVLLVAACRQVATPGVSPTLAPSETPLPPPPTPTETRPPPTHTPAPTDTATPQATPTQATPERLVIDPETAENLAQAGQLQESGAMTFSWIPGSPSLAVASQDQVSLYQISPPAETEQIEVDQLSMLTASPDQSVLAWVSNENAVHLLDLAAEGRPQAVISDTAPITGLAFSPGGEQLAVAGNDLTMDSYEVSTSQQVASWEIPNWLVNLSYSPDGSRLAGVDPQSFTLYIYDAATGEELRALTWTEHASPVLYGAHLSPDWEQVAWVARGTVQLMDVETGELGATLSHEDFIGAFAWSPDGNLIATGAAGAVEGEFAPLVTIWDVSGGEKVNTLVQPEPVLSLAFSPDGQELGTLYGNGTLQLWAVAP